MLVMGSSCLQSANEWGGGVVLEKTAVLPHPHPMLPVTIIVPQINPKRDPLPMGRGHWQWVVDIGNVVYNQTTLQPTPFCLSVM